MGRQDRFFNGEWFARLPAKCVNVPFGGDSRMMDEWGITDAAFEVVVAILAAEFTQMGPVSAPDLDEVIDRDPRPHLYRLERLGWIESVGKVPRRTSKLYKPTAKAWRELLPDGWSLLREVA
jgi:hypothetical protein